MESTSLRQTKFDAEILKCAQVTHALETKLKSFGFLENAKPTTAGDIFKIISNPRSTEIVESLTYMLEEFSGGAGFTRHGSITQLTNFLARKNLYLPDDSFTDCIDEGDVVEIYDARGVQLWRNWLYYKFSPYTPREILTNSWNDLFARPTQVTDTLMQMMPALFGPEATTIAYDIAPHLIAARRFPDRESLMFKMKRATSVWTMQDQPTAFITTSAVTTMPTAKFRTQIDFI